jgi:hypothetical protein
LNRLIAVRLARKQMTPATTTRRQSCSMVRQLKTRNMMVLAAGIDEMGSS